MAQALHELDVLLYAKWEFHHIINLWLLLNKHVPVKYVAVLNFNDLQLQLLHRFVLHIFF